MTRAKLDKIDKNILKNLQNSGRMTNVDLAKEVGISAPPCLRRVRVLEENDLIKGYHARVNQRALGYGVTVFAHVKLQSQADTELRKFEKKVEQWERVRECWLLTGETDFLLKVVAKNWEDFHEFLTNELMTLPNIDGVKSSLSIRVSKELPGVPIEE